MPDLVVSDDGEMHLLARALLGADAPASVWTLRLFSNDYTPNRDTVLADLTECAWSGYVPIDLDPLTWATPTNPSGVAVSLYGDDFQIFQPVSGSNTVFGYFITFDGGAELLLSQRFDTAQVGSSTVPVLVWPVLQSRSMSSPAP